jgi:putative ABC transport system ATP-binding protein
MAEEEKQFLSAHRIYKEYPMGKVIVKALRGVDVNIKKGEFVFIIGPSGSGKSTLMHMLGALDQPTRGRVTLQDHYLPDLYDWQLSMIRRNKVGFIFQTFNLIPSLNAIDNVILPMLTEKSVDEDTLMERAIMLLKEVGLGERIYHTPNEMSGGERQRVAIARSLINYPEIVLADEPTGNLDSVTGRQIFDLMRRLNRKHGKTIVIVTHDTEYIEKGDRVYHIKDGIIQETYHYNGRNHPGEYKPKKCSTK